MLQKSSTSRTLEVFFLNPTKDHYLMDISRNIKIAHTSVKKNLDDLVKLGLIIEKIDRKGKRKYPLFKANLDSKEFKQQKMLYNLQSLLQSGFMQYLEEKIMPKCIILFGSYQRGEDIEDSDIDLYVQAEEETVEIKAFEKKLQRKIELHFKPKFSDYSKELKNNIINGIVLFGFLEGYK
ncbi:MAG: nucleotidyltransferase domain-containing protein [Candidatus Woesearchaeota archaeon]|jgi:predicted nucleotidyltransferase|nr:nucleotidyltransferase domain-containing protein [Candidatus Woesearchaeota archaeon]MDP7457992.1 nucleotidyltransferase domain-containing protein [Candidatus Woesearchaeota archaeon]